MSENIEKWTGSVWLRHAGASDEIDAVLQQHMRPGLPTDPAEVCAYAETALFERKGDDRSSGRALMWAAASLGSKRACMRIAEEIEVVVRDGAFPPEESERLTALIDDWRQKGKGTRMNLSGLNRTETASLHFEPPFHAPRKGRSTGQYLDFSASRTSAPVNCGSEAVIVVRRIGDANSTDGAQLKTRYGGIVGRPLPCSGAMPEHGHVRDAISQDWPWAEHVGARLEGWLSVQRYVGLTYGRLNPLLLVGPPGAGKTRLARRIAELLGLPVTVLPAAGSADGGSFSAVTRDWRNSRPCGPVVAAAEAGCCNPAIVIDEIDKAVAAGSRNGSVIGPLLGMLGEPSNYYDASLMSEVDLSRITFLATANDLSAMDAPILDRFEVLEIGRPSLDHLPVILSTMRNAEAERLGVHPAFLPELDVEEYAALRDFFVEGTSLRALERAHRYLLGEAAARETAQLPN